MGVRGPGGAARVDLPPGPPAVPPSCGAFGSMCPGLLPTGPPSWLPGPACNFVTVRVTSFLSLAPFEFFSPGTVRRPWKAPDLAGGAIGQHQRHWEAYRAGSLAPPGFITTAMPARARQHLDDVAAAPRRAERGDGLGTLSRAALPAASPPARTGSGGAVIAREFSAFAGYRQLFQLLPAALAPSGPTSATARSPGTGRTTTPGSPPPAQDRPARQVHRQCCRRRKLELRGRCGPGPPAIGRRFQARLHKHIACPSLDAAAPRPVRWLGVLLPASAPRALAVPLSHRSITTVLAGMLIPRASVSVGVTRPHSPPRTVPPPPLEVGQQPAWWAAMPTLQAGQPLRDSEQPPCPLGRFACGAAPPRDESPLFRWSPQPRPGTAHRCVAAGREKMKRDGRQQPACPAAR